MDVFEAIRTKLEVREFSERRVPDEVKLKVLEAARLTPSGLNSQHWRFILVEEKEGLRKLAETSTTGRWISGADFAVIVLTNPRYRFHMIDAGRAIQDMQLTAWSYGVLSCIYTGVREDEMRRVFNIPGELSVTAVVGFGYPKRKVYGRKRRLPLEEIAFSESYGRRLRLLE